MTSVDCRSRRSTTLRACSLRLTSQLSDTASTHKCKFRATTTTHGKGDSRLDTRPGMSAYSHLNIYNACSIIREYFVQPQRTILRLSIVGKQKIIDLTRKFVFKGKIPL